MFFNVGSKPGRRRTSSSSSSVSVSSTEFASKPQGRLTLTTATPVMIATASAQTTVYYTPYLGRHVPLYDGSSFAMADTGGELSQATTDATKSPAAVTTNSNYDVFVWDDSGTMRATRGPPWSSDTSRGTGGGTTELVRTNGLLLNANAITNGPGALRGTYVGTIRSDGSSQINWTMGALSAGGTAAVLGVWNCYNRVVVMQTVQDSTNSWSYNSGTWRSADSSATMRVSFVLGLAEDAFRCEYSCSGLGAAGTTADATSVPFVGIGYDVTNALTSGTRTKPMEVSSVIVATPNGTSEASYTKSASDIGFHFVQAIEKRTGANSVTFYGDNNDTTSYQNGLYFEGRF